MRAETKQTGSRAIARGARRRSTRDDGSRRGLRGYTLIEILVVIFIILLVSAVTLPTVIPALTHRQVSEAARIVQAALAGARDAAIRNNEPRGIRLIPDPVFNGQGLPTLAYNRIVPIEPAPDYNNGMVSIFPKLGTLNPQMTLTNYVAGLASYGLSQPGLVLFEETFSSIGAGFPNEQTSWYWNIRVGDKIRFSNAGNYYTVVGPIKMPNADRFVNIGPPGTVVNDPNGQPYPEFLFLVNGVDDNQNGYVDESYDGFDNDGNGCVDWPTDLCEVPTQFQGVLTACNACYLATSIPPFVAETELWVGAEAVNGLNDHPYTIKRRPVPTQGARDIALPEQVVIDATTWNSPMSASPSLPERSRLPIDPISLQVDIMLDPGGRVLPTTLYSTPTDFANAPFYHIWLAERQDVHEPLWGYNGIGVPKPNPSYPNMQYTLPMPLGSGDPIGTTTYSYTDNTSGTAPTRFLKGERRLITVGVQTGQITINEVEVFDVLDVSYPFYQPQLGARNTQ